jgi:phosphopantothenoylcysteine decarboxylase / phosphopantothenate---cysteine ligase
VAAAVRDADALVMAAAPADFRPATYAEHKIKKTDDVSAPTIELVQNPDVLAEISHNRPRPDLVVVGFAAETGDAQGTALEHGRTKLARKGCDLLVVNEVGVGRGFEVPDNEAVILDVSGHETPVPRGPKDALAHRIWDLVVQRWPS